MFDNDETVESDDFENRGFVYVMTTESSPGYLKIGKTKKVPTERAKELDTTGSPTPQIVEYYALFDDMHQAESMVHKILDEYRVRQSREWFIVDVRSAIQEIEGLEISFTRLYIKDEANSPDYNYQIYQELISNIASEFALSDSDISTIERKKIIRFYRDLEKEACESNHIFQKLISLIKDNKYYLSKLGERYDHEKEHAAGLINDELKSRYDLNESALSVDEKALAIDYYLLCREDGNDELRCIEDLFDAINDGIVKINQIKLLIQKEEFEELFEYEFLDQFELTFDDLSEAEEREIHEKLIPCLEAGYSRMGCVRGILKDIYNRELIIAALDDFCVEYIEVNLLCRHDLTWKDLTLYGKNIFIEMFFSCTNNLPSTENQSLFNVCMRKLSEFLNSNKLDEKFIRKEKIQPIVKAEETKEIEKLEKPEKPESNRKKLESKVSDRDTQVSTIAGGINCIDSALIQDVNNIKINYSLTEFSSEVFDSDKLDNNEKNIFIIILDILFAKERDWKKVDNILQALFQAYGGVKPFLSLEVSIFSKNSGFRNVLISQVLAALDALDEINNFNIDDDN